MSQRRGAMSQGRALMVVGTHSDAGKSILVTALCRIFAREGLAVAPFKSQNMSLNAGVTPEGHEIARSTYVQAEAAGVAPHVDMNPVLLKPEADHSSQVVLDGRPWGRVGAGNWFETKELFWRHITAAFDRLRARSDLVILEGAGSPAEINLMKGDVANLRVARHAAAPALLVGDIDRGGVFAALVGTMVLLPPEERALIRGFVINKLRGDPALLGDGLEMLRERAFGVPTLGVVPFLPDLGIAEEDSVALTKRREPTGPAADGELDVAVVHLPHVANFDDFDPLAAEDGVRVRFVRSSEELGAPAVVILPGSKATLADLEWLTASGMGRAILELARGGARVVGICGGFQILGETLSDPQGSEAAPGTRAEGLALLPLSTRFVAEKQTVQVRGTCRASRGALAEVAGTTVTAYEIHMGRTEIRGPGCEPVFRLEDEAGGESTRSDGASSRDGQVWGTYLHGVFDNDDFRHGWLETLGWHGEGRRFDRQPAYDRLADHVQAHLDLDALRAIIWGPKGP